MQQTRFLPILAIVDIKSDVGQLVVSYAFNKDKQKILVAIYEVKSFYMRVIKNVCRWHKNSGDWVKQKMV